MINIRSTIARVRAVLGSASELAHARAEQEHLQRYTVRLRLAERWARCAAEHDERTPHWRPLLSAGALVALLSDDLSTLEAWLGERAKWVGEFDRDPESGDPTPTARQQVGVVCGAMFSELIAAQNKETAHYFMPPQVGSKPPAYSDWDRQKLDPQCGSLLNSAEQQAESLLETRLGLSRSHGVSPEA